MLDIRRRVRLDGFTMKSTSFTISNDLDAELDALAREQNRSRSDVVEAALRRYLNDVRVQRSTDNADDFVPFWVPVLQEKDDCGEPDVSVNHDHYLAEDLYRRKLGTR
jgi:hypothetical protein